MEPVLAFLLGFLLFVDHGGDPSLEAWKGRRAVRALECDRLPQEQAHRLHPGRVPEAGPRAATTVTADALVCTRRLVPFGERPARDELIITTLGERVAELTQLASALGTERTNWHVDGFYPDIEIATRIAGAARTELAQRGLRVSNEAPLLAAGDLLVLRQLDTHDAFALACERYFAEGALIAPDDAFLALALVDEHESELHVGVCMNGGWRWLR